MDCRLTSKRNLPCSQTGKILQAPTFPLFSLRLLGHTRAPMSFDYNVSRHSCFTMCIVLDDIFCSIRTRVFHNYPRAGWLCTPARSALPVQRAAIISGICIKTTPPDSVLRLSAVTWQLLCPFLINTPWLSSICIFSNTHSRSQLHLSPQKSSIL